MREYRFACVKVKYGGGFDCSFGGAEVSYPLIQSEAEIEQWTARQVESLRKDPRNCYNMIFIFLDESLNVVRRIEFPALSWLDRPREKEEPPAKTSKPRLLLSRRKEKAARV